MAKAADRLGPFASSPQRLAQIGMKGGLSPIPSDRASDQFDRVGQMPGLQCQGAQVVQRVRMIGFRGQDLSIDPFGLGQLAGLMVASAQGQCFGDVQHDPAIIVQPRAWSTTESTYRGRPPPNCE